MRATLIASLSLLALAGCVETPPYVASSAPLPPSGPYPGPASGGGYSGQPGAGGPAMPPPPLASQLQNVTASHVTQVPGHSDCSDYSVTGTLAGRAETVTGRSCRLPGGGLQVTERDPATGQVSHTTYPAPSQAQSQYQSQYPAQGPAGGVNYGTAGPYGGGVPYGYDYPYAYGYPYAFGDPFFFGYPFFGFGYGFYGGYGFRGGYGFHGGYGGGFHGGYGGGFHGGGGGFHGGGGRR